MKNVRNAKNVWNVRNVLHIFYHFCIKRFCKILQVLTGLNLQDLAKTFDGKNKICKEFKVCEECVECEECVTHFLPFLCKTFLQVLTGLDVQNLAKTFGGKKICKEFKVCEECEECEECVECVTHFLPFVCKTFLQVLTGLHVQNLAKTLGGKKICKEFKVCEECEECEECVECVTHFLPFLYKMFLQDLTGLDVQNLAKTFSGKKYVKNLRYVKNVRNAKNVWNVLHIFYHFCIKCFCKILQVLTGLNLQNLAKTFDRKKKNM